MCNDNFYDPATEPYFGDDEQDETVDQLDAIEEQYDDAEQYEVDEQCNENDEQCNDEQCNDAALPFIKTAHPPFYNPCRKNPCNPCRPCKPCIKPCIITCIKPCCPPPCGVGPVGPQGPRGPRGFIGPQGPKGCSGAVGATGPMGPKGCTGATGPMGPKGCTGATGPMGPKGCTGAVGATGPMGPKGCNGAVGATGPMGPKGCNGAVGATGPMGPKGCTGSTGPMGPKGCTGSTGPMGPKGCTGATGPQGPRGCSGPQGPQGIPGPNVSQSIIPLGNGGPLCIVSPCMTLGGFISPLGFGATNSLAVLATPIIDLKGTYYTAFRLPYDCVVKKLTAFFIAEKEANLGCNNVTITFALYKSECNSDVFKIIPESFMKLSPSFSGCVSVGDSASCNKNVCIPLCEGTRIMAVLSCIKTNKAAISLQGNAQAGLGIQI